MTGPPEVVDFHRSHRMKRREERVLIRKVPRDQLHPVLDVGDPLEVHRGAAPNQPGNPVSLLQQKFGEITPILPGDSGDQSRFHESLYASRSFRGKAVKLDPDEEAVNAPSSFEALTTWR